MHGRNKVELNIEGHFLQRIVYNDDITYSLVGAASEVLGMILLSYSYGIYFTSIFMPLSFPTIAILSTNIILALKGGQDVVQREQTEVSRCHDHLFDSFVLKFRD